MKQKPAHSMRSLMGAEPGTRKRQPNTVDHSTMDIDLDLAAQFLDQFAAWMTGKEEPKNLEVRCAQASQLARKLRDRAEFRRNLFTQLSQIEQQAQGRKEEDETVESTD